MHWQGSDLTLRWLSITASFVAVVVVLDVIEYRTGSHAFLYSRCKPGLAWGLGLAVATGVTLYLATSSPLPFVYFQF